MCKQDEDDEDPTVSTVDEEKAKAAAGATAAKEAGKQGGKGKKRSGEDIIEREKERSKKAKEAATKKAEWFELKQNTSVYVSGLPSDVTEEEVAQVKCSPFHMRKVLLCRCSGIMILSAVALPTHASVSPADHRCMP